MLIDLPQMVETGPGEPGMVAEASQIRINRAWPIFLLIRLGKTTSIWQNRGPQYCPQYCHRKYGDWNIVIQKSMQKDPAINMLLGLPPGK